MAHHIFALFVPELIIVGDRVVIDHKEFFQRVAEVLRLRNGDDLILFDGRQRVQGKLVLQGAETRNKKTITLVVDEAAVCAPIAPQISFYPGLIKKTPFEEVIYAAAALGVTTMTPLLCEKMHKEKFESKDRERGHKMIIAACEQAKSYVLPTLNLPCSFDAMLSNSQQDSVKIYYDATGIPAADWLQTVAGAKVQSMTVVCGPEAGFSDHEIAALDKAGFTKVALTPTILRAEHAAWVGLGMIRSYLK